MKEAPPFINIYIYIYIYIYIFDKRDYNYYKIWRQRCKLDRLACLNTDTKRQIAWRQNWNIFLTIIPFVPNAPFLYSLKTSENRKDSWSLQGVEKVCVGNEWVKMLSLCLKIRNIEKIYVWERLVFAF